eukprot:CAMPEP_0206230416 /NCGR_PEP_ID=MMETSP0047_2-20121206/10250_1 /ASSEMBLY_ACC=CAM_ASM_000192 /TAXON_ID=195065 /ORGANISM="Chroomonas mesostigmatica_cf, Strain CCMP1168" /LENGTH=196 /DNA_ID=CAMNT_0053653843 /DNA_START=1261 /DNA_END=1848 /DNA_ORIENTATION=-
MATPPRALHQAARLYLLYSLSISSSLYTRLSSPDSLLTSRAEGKQQGTIVKGVTTIDNDTLPVRPPSLDSPLPPPWTAALRLLGPARAAFSRVSPTQTLGRKQAQDEEIHTRLQQRRQRDDGRRQRRTTKRIRHGGAGPERGSAAAWARRFAVGPPPEEPSSAFFPRRLPGGDVRRRDWLNPCVSHLSASGGFSGT